MLDNVVDAAAAVLFGGGDVKSLLVLDEDLLSSFLLFLSKSLGNTCMVAAVSTTPLRNGFSQDGPFEDDIMDLSSFTTLDN